MNDGLSRQPLGSLAGGEHHKGTRRLEAVREQTDLLRTSLIGRIFRSLSLNRPTIRLK
jgi:hypothetical protein